MWYSCTWLEIENAINIVEVCRNEGGWELHPRRDFKRDVPISKEV